MFIKYLKIFKYTFDGKSNNNKQSFERVNNYLDNTIKTLKSYIRNFFEEVAPPIITKLLKCINSKLIKNLKNFISSYVKLLPLRFVFGNRNVYPISYPSQVWKEGEKWIAFNKTAPPGPFENNSNRKILTCNKYEEEKNTSDSKTDNKLEIEIDDNSNIIFDNKEVSNDTSTSEMENERDINNLRNIFEISSNGTKKFKIEKCNNLSETYNKV